MKQLDGRVAVVTGAASGIGRATSEAFAREGCHLALVDVNEAGLSEAADAISQLGRRVSTHVVDVSDREQMQVLPEKVLAEHDQVHVVMNNAGVTVSRRFEDHSLEDLDWVVGINFWGVVYGCKFFLPHLRNVDEAHIVNISSMASLIGFPMQSSYSATKFAVHGLSEALWMELSDTQIGVTSVHPATIRTSILRSARGDESKFYQRLLQMMERYGRPPEVVAKRIVRAVRKRKPRLVIGSEAHLTDWAKRLAPFLPNRLLGLGFRISKP